MPSSPASLLMALLSTSSLPEKKCTKVKIRFFLNSGKSAEAVKASDTLSGSQAQVFAPILLASVAATGFPTGIALASVATWLPASPPRSSPPISGEGSSLLLLSTIASAADSINFNLINMHSI